MYDYLLEVLNMWYFLLIEFLDVTKYNFFNHILGCAI